MIKPTQRKSQLILRELNTNDEQAFLQGYEDWKSESLDWYTFVWRPGMAHIEHLQALQNQKDKTKIPSSRVPSTMLYGFVDGKIVGRFNIRHELNAYLQERGGHVGYAVSPSQRKMGFASEMFRQGLEYCRKLALTNILVTCADQNIPSWKIIGKFGGSLENKIYDSEDHEWVRRYWIELVDSTFDSTKVTDKVVAYITRQKKSQIQLLVFDHDEQYADAGTQVPSGTVNLGEDPMTALFREVEEETGLVGFLGAEKIDQYQFFAEHSKKYLRRHVYHIPAKGTEAETWTHIVKGHGEDQGLKFHYFWIDVKVATGMLSGRFDTSVDALIQKLEISS